jgi:hypothetical protein
MAATITYTTTPPVTDTTFATQTVVGSIALTGNYTQFTGSAGEALNFTTHAVGVINYLVSNQRPGSVLFWEEPAAGTLPTGLTFSYRNTATKPTAANGYLQISGASSINSSGVTTAGFELAAGAYPTILTGTVLKFRAFFPLGR